MKKQKTVKLNDNFRLTNGVVEVFIYRCENVKYDNRDVGGTDDRCDSCKRFSSSDSCDCDAWAWVPSKYKVGNIVMLVSHTDVSPDALRRGSVPRFSLVFDSPDGIGGNTDRNVTRYHGWRGTTCDLSCDAHGLREIKSIRALNNGTVAVTVGSDLRPDEE